MKIRSEREKIRFEESFLKNVMEIAQKYKYVSHRRLHPEQTSIIHSEKSKQGILDLRGHLMHFLNIVGYFLPCTADNEAFYKHRLLWH